MSTSDRIEVSVWRGGAAGAFQTFHAPRYESQTVLDVVAWIQQNEDPTLSYRFACRVGMCGSCGMMVNGVPRWTCRTHVDKVLEGGRMEVAPLRNLPVVKDLATDMDPFFDKWTAAGVYEGEARREDPVAEIAPDGAEREAASKAIECINCGVCYAACDTVAAQPDYLGPAALNRAWTLLNDEKHGDKAGLLAAVTGADGCLNCHSMGSCTRHCPNELTPMDSIAGLKRAAARAFWRR